jgi:hypothetical protein
LLTYSGLWSVYFDAGIATDGSSLGVWDSSGINYGSVPYSSAYTWWRLQPSADGHVEGLYSLDGATWTFLGARPAPSVLGTQIDFNLGAGVKNIAPAPGRPRSVA